MSRAIVNIAVCDPGSWYTRGQNRLMESLKKFGEDTFYFKTYDRLVLKSVYEDKILSVKEAREQGYTKLLYLDCSITAIRPLDDIWNHIDEHGYYLYSSGDNCAVTCNDHCLDSYGYTRDEAASVPECASNVVGIDLDSEKGLAFYYAWTASLGDGSNIGKKWPSKTERLMESLDPRFKYHRQDQSTASLSAHKHGLVLDRADNFVTRWESNSVNEKTIFVLKGGE